MMSLQRGSVAVEAAFGLPILILVIFSWLDFCVMGYAMAVADHAITSSVAKTKKLGRADSTKAINYEKALEDEVKESAGFLWPSVIQKDSVEAKIYYFNDYESLKLCNNLDKPLDECNGAGNVAKNRPIALYQLSFKYKPVFNYFWKPMEMKREVISIQEYERCKFKIGPGASCAL